MGRVRANSKTAPYEIGHRPPEIGLTATLTATGFLDGSVGGADGRLGANAGIRAEKLPEASASSVASKSLGARTFETPLSARPPAVAGIHVAGVLSAAEGPSRPPDALERPGGCL
jgi:hypothetical protein